MNISRVFDSNGQTEVIVDMLHLDARVSIEHHFDRRN